ncbi:helix-turn-helix domain-containing protein [Brevibacillus reuszeri]|uniref:helix-turn-helix domain-containing protein n=1 Tax=Brevibacillus reuszeri TaxID=54915 RepID=UPI00289FC7AE|nr:helix-turn-helix domain-containing protein [Brevibacillus reuszeri]
MNSPNSAGLELDFLCTIALNAMIPLSNERTLQAAFYILRGRKANQTLQDVHLYNLYPYYRMFPRFTKEDWDKIVSTLLQKEFIRPISRDEHAKKSTFVVTQAGKDFAQAESERYQLKYWLAPFTQSDMAERLGLFWPRLHLLVQTVSHLLVGELGFVPVVSDKHTQRWVRAELQDHAARETWKGHLEEELYALLQPLPAEAQELIIAQLSGAAQVGKTLGQLAQKKRETPSYLHLPFRYGLAASILRLQREPEQFPLLSRLVIQNHKFDSRLTDSAAKTYELIQRGLGKTEVAGRRGIKESTVEDHLVEMALRCPEWDFSAYLSKELGETIVQTSEQLQTSRLRMIKDHLDQSVSYLQIRLALARRQGEKVT